MGVLSGRIARTGVSEIVLKSALIIGVIIVFY